MRVKTQPLSAALIFLAALTGCIDTRGAWDLQEAAQALDAQPVSQTPPTATESSASNASALVSFTPREPLFPEGQRDLQAPTPSSNILDLGRGHPQATLDLSTSCAALPPLSTSRPILVVLAVQDTSPAAALMFDARSAHQQMIACYESQGVQVFQETRLGQAHLDQLVQILVY